MIEITTETKNNIFFIYLKGEIDATSSIHLDNVLQEAKNKNIKNIALDLQNLNYISSAGLGVFVSYIEYFEENNIQLILYQVKESVKQVFSILGLEKLIMIVDSKEEAINNFHVV